MAYSLFLTLSVKQLFSRRSRNDVHYVECVVKLELLPFAVNHLRRAV